MMRIGVDARLMQHQPAGISRYTRHLLRELAKLDQHDEYIVFQHRRHRTPLVEQANFRRATLSSPVHSRIEQWLLPLELLRFSLDLLHTTDFIPPLYTTVPTVITVHDLAFLHWPHFLTEKSAAYYGQIDRAVRHAKHIIVPSESTKQDLTAMLGVPPIKISVIYEAADELFVPLPLQPTRSDVMKTYHLPESFILFVGTIEPRKNVDGLIRAFHHLRSKYGVNDTALVIAGGSGWLYAETLQLIRQLGLEDCVVLVGRIADEELHKLYVSARCHVHPAHYEGFGLPPLEAMACGTPTIVSNVSSLPEVVGDAALLIDPSNWEEIAVAIHRLLSDDQLHAELREKGLQRARHFSWESAARRTLEVYRLVADSRAALLASGTPASSRPSNRL
jgi:glycosyltransferase involved in cell wall biosynthesis